VILSHSREPRHGSGPAELGAHPPGSLGSGPEAKLLNMQREL